MTFVNPFLYRLPRFDVNFSLDFVLGDSITTGHCLNLSHTGILARFAYPLRTGAAGSLRLKPASRVFELRAHVTHTEGLRSGLQFDFANDQEQQVIVALVEAISRHALDQR